MQEYILETGACVDADRFELSLKQVNCKENVSDNALLLSFHLVNFSSAMDKPSL